MIESLRLPKSTIGENPIRFPLPTSEQMGTVTVLCGPNGSGKSFILLKLKSLIDGKQASRNAEGWSIEPKLLSSDIVLKSHHHKSQMTSIGTLSKKQATKKLQHNDNDIKLTRDLFGLAFSVVDTAHACRLIDKLDFDFEKWNADAEYRSLYFDQFKEVDEEEIFWLSDTKPELFRLLEAEFKAQIGIRHSTHGFEFVLAWRSKVVASFQNWSDGQKSFFTILATVSILNPEIYIFDEIENFFHPQLITRTITFLKEHVRQLIISSHHPHLIFGNAVDEVYYIETNDDNNVRFPSRVKKVLQQPSLPRKITRLSTDWAKLSHAYRLFDYKDAALVSKAHHFSDWLKFHVVDALHGLYGCAAVSSKKSVFQDGQSQKIAEFISEFDPNPKIILDWGAGLGRTFSEFHKKRKVEGDLKWYLYEPFEESFEKLKGVAKQSQIPITLLRNRSDLDIGAGIVLLTNVMHVLGPTEWTIAVADAWQNVKKSKTGVIIVTEIYPLLAAERSAIPIPDFKLAEFFRALGFLVTTRSFVVGGATSYCLIASNAPSELTEATIKIEVDVLWRSLFQHYLNEYEGIGVVNSSSAHRDLLNATFGMATVSKYYKPFV